MTRSLSISTFLAVGLFFAAALFHALFGYYFSGQAGFSVGNDDAFITYRYAQNLIEHGVLTFNPTDPQPVEGFSNPMFVALAAMVYLVTGPNLLYPAMATLGALSVALAITLLGRSLWHGAIPALSLPIMLGAALCPPLWIHGTSGLETSWVLLFQIIIWIQCRRINEIGSLWDLAPLLLATGVLALLRTDGFVYPILAASWLALTGRWRAAGLVVAVACGVFAGQVSMRLWYYGLPLPLPVYVKVSGSLLERLDVAARYLGGVAVWNGLFLPLVGALTAGIIWAWRSFSRRSLPVFLSLPFELWMMSGIIAYYLYIGGDIYRDRFIVILFPMGTYLLLSQLYRWTARDGLLIGAVAVIVWQLGAAVIGDRRLDYTFEMPKYDRWIVLGTFLAERHPDFVLATGAAGKLPFFSRLETIDMLGLNTPQIAFTNAQGATPGHNKYDPNYVFARRPNIICAHTFGSGSMAWGIDRERYLAEGYQLRYLVRDRSVNGPNLVEVRNTSDSEIEGLVAAGYTYGCVIRN